VPVIVKPDTVIAWHHKGIRLFWTRKVRHGRPDDLSPAARSDVSPLMEKSERRALDIHQAVLARQSMHRAMSWALLSRIHRYRRTAHCLSVLCCCENTFANRLKPFAMPRTPESFVLEKTKLMENISRVDSVFFLLRIQNEPCRLLSDGPDRFRIVQPTLRISLSGHRRSRP
jgi:hypothetical protein